jgi:hypothetical protein
MTKTALLATASAVLATAFALGAAPAAGQTVTVTVDYPVTFVTTGEPIRERNLDEPVPAELDPAALNLTETFNFAPNGGETVGDNFILGGLYTSATQTERRVFVDDVVRIIDERNGSPGDIQLRGLGPDALVLTVKASDMNDARQSLLVTANVEGRRHFAGMAVFTGGGAVVETDRILNQRLTGRDLTTAVSQTIGGSGGSTGASNFVIFGTRNNCPSENSTIGCEAGNRYEVLPSQQAFNVVILTTLYITNSVERTLTGGTTFFDVPLTPLPSGAVHALAAQGALGGGQRFLERLGDHAGMAQPSGLWGDIAGTRQRFDAAGPLAASALDGMAARLGFDQVAAPGLTLGLAGEYASDDLAIADPVTPESGTLERWSLGAHARLDSGRLTASLAAQVGTASIDTSGVSDLGAARADYDATTYGVAGRIGVRLGKGPLTLTPEVGASWNRWERDGFAESGGPAPLTVLAANNEQTRLWAGGRLGWQSGPERRRVTLAAYGRAVRVGGDRSPAITAFDPQLPDLPLVTLGPQMDETRGEFGASATLGLGSSGSLRIGWDAASDGNLDAHALTATLLIAL